MRTLLPVLSLLLAGGLAAQQGLTAFDVFEQGRAAERAGRMTEAYLAYSRAAAMEPSNRTYWQRSQSVRFRALLEGMSSAPITSQTPVIEEPVAAIPEATYQDRMAAEQPLPPTKLIANDVRLDFDLRGDSRKLFEDVAKAFGLECIFDKEYDPGPEMRFRVTDMDYRAALYALEEATASFAFPISTKTIFVARDTPQKRTELEPMAAITIPVPSAIAPADFNAMRTAVQQALALERVVVDNQNNTVIIRDRISKVLPAQALFRDLMRNTGQLSIEMRLLQVSQNDMIEYGVAFPNFFSLNFLTNYLQNQLQIPTNISGLLTFGGGKTLMGLGFLTPQLVAQLSDVRGKVLYDAEMQTVEGQAAEMHVGERYPVATSGYFGPSSFSGPNAYIPPPSFSYVDLGLELKVTSRLHGSDEVTMDVDAEFKLLTGQEINGSPVLSNREVKSNIRLRLGEWAVLAGLANPSESVILSGVPILSRIPALSFLTAQKTKTTTDDQLLILLRPRLKGLPPQQIPVEAYRLGSDTRPLIPL